MSHLLMQTLDQVTQTFTQTIEQLRRKKAQIEQLEEISNRLNAAGLQVQPLVTLNAGLKLICEDSYNTGVPIMRAIGHQCGHSFCWNGPTDRERGSFINKANENQMIDVCFNVEIEQ